MIRRRLLPLLLLFVASVPATAAAAPIDPATPGVWDEITYSLSARSAANAPVETAPERFSAFELDQAGLRETLADAPLEDAERAGEVVTIPAPDGSLQRFEAVESPVYTDGFAQRYPRIRTYAARGVDDPTATARFDVTPLGFRASVMSESGRWLVDPYYRNDRSAYVSYYRRDLKDPQSPLLEPADAAEELAADVPRGDVERAPGDPVISRTYRLAMTNDPSYSQYFGTTDELVEAAKASLMNRVNQLYNDDLAIRMLLVANDAKLNFKTDQEYTAAGFGSGACSGTLLNQNQTVIDREIGDANYDIGHIVKRAGGGGIAGLGVVGRTGQKARGCTGVDPPIGDGFAIDYVAHEMGHQFGGPHTFDGITVNCMPPNRDADGVSAVEPGSGTTIQAYAGICGDDDLQPNSDPYFSQQSIDDILGYVNSNLANEEEEGSTLVTTANRAPIVTAPADKFIPVRTPFTLTGDATDADGNDLVYLWEQDDSGTPVGKPLRSDAKSVGPLFRVFGVRAVEDKLQSPAPGQNIATAADRIRSFPDPVQVAQDNTNAETGSCGTGTSSIEAAECFAEYLPTPAYAQGEMTFRLTARDRVLTGGGMGRDDVTLSIAGATPFQVTAPSGTGGTRTGGTMVNVTWSNAQTNLPPFSVANVRISFSEDGGRTFPVEVVASTPNDGAEMVMVPNIATTGGRFKVEAIGNYFYDVSDRDIQVTPGAGPTGPSGPSGPTPTPTSTPTATVTPSATPTLTPTATVFPTPYPVVRQRPGLAVRVKPKRDRRKPFRFRVAGRLSLPAGIAPTDGCRGRVTIRVKRKNSAKVLRRKSRPVRSTCDFATKVGFRNFKAFKGARRGKLRFVVRFSGNEKLTPRRVVRTAKYGGARKRR